MPWCEHCSRFWSPNTVGADGLCPTCQRPLPQPATAARAAASTEPERIKLREVAGASARTPWHFKLLVVAVVLYLGWRLVQLIQALV